MINARLISRLKRVDWDFSDNFSDSPFSSFHWHPARFASQLAASFIGLLTRPDGLVVDSFVGSGTTLVEAQRLGRRGIGIDLNPISCLTTQSKTLVESSEKIEQYAATLKSDASSLLGRQRLPGRRDDAEGTIPTSVQFRKWYTPEVSRNLGQLWKRIQKYNGSCGILAKAAFSSILLSVCRETRHLGYVCDNSQPHGHHGGDVLGEFSRAIDKLSAAYRRRDEELTLRFGRGRPAEVAEVICGDAREVLRNLPPNSVDLVLTSPPYFGVYDYAKTQRLSLEWFGTEIEALRSSEIGARSKRHRRTAVEEYLSGLESVFLQARRILHENGALVVIIGQSASRQTVLNEVRERLKRLGFVLQLDQNRRVRSQRPQDPSIMGEHVLLFS